MSYATAEAFRQALEARVRKAAEERRQSIERVRQLVVFDRFLARVFAAFGERVILKGGAALELRVAHARTTRDIDLRLTGKPEDLQRMLLRALAVERHDFFTFVIEPDGKHPAITGPGLIYDGQRYRAEARLGSKIYGERFGVDAGFGDVLTTAAELHRGSDLLEFAGIAPEQYRVYPREAHVAEKLHAYTLPRDRENTRMKDLPDLALLAMTGSFEASAVRAAIEATFAFRKTHAIPASLPDPPEAWRSAYDEVAERDSLPWRDLVAVVAAARAFVDPILNGRDGRWDATAWLWQV